MSILDFAIVGGGAGGTYSAWRLAHASKEEVEGIRKRIGGAGPLTIGLFERTDRIGGRLLSCSPSVMPDVTMEIGGMRYLDNQPLVKGLVENKLNMKRHEQVVDDPKNFAYLRGQLFRQDELCLSGVELPYGLTNSERLVVNAPGNATPAQLIFWAVYQEFPEVKQLQTDPQKLREFLRSAEVDGKPLYQVGFWNLLSRHLSHEGRELAITAIGYDVLGANANAVDIIAENFDFTPDAKYYLFDDGYESMLWDLAAQFEGAESASASITCEAELESFDEVKLTDGGAGYELTFQDGKTVQARAVVLGLPRWAIKNLRKKGPVLDPDRAPEVQTMLNSVEGIPLYKLFVVYKQPWWQEEWGRSVGRSLTDIPVRQCYYWSTNTGQPSAIMAYNDQASTSFWGGFQTGPLGPRDTAQGREGPAEGPWLFKPLADDQSLPADEIAKRRRKNWDAHPAPHEMVMEMHRQLMEMHGMTEAPEPIDAAYMDWMNQPYGGAVHFWNPGYKSWELLHAMTRPVKTANVFVVGEAYSTVQTWVEGAFQTSEIFLQEHMGMRMPNWVEGDVALWR